MRSSSAVFLGEGCIMVEQIVTFIWSVTFQDKQPQKPSFCWIIKVGGT